MTKRAAGASHDAWLQQQLKDPGFAAEYLTAAAEDAEPAVYLAALRQVAEARGIADVAARAGLPRESVYRALSPKGNPRWRTLAAILRATGLKLAVTRPAA
jgi:probable addiction module antidote protein